MLTTELTSSTYSIQQCLEQLNVFFFIFLAIGYYWCYIGETSRHFSTRIKEHTVSDKNSHIFKHLS